MIKVGIVCGGISSEHEISCISAGGILSSIDRSKYQPLLIGITKSGKWVLPGETYPLKIIDGVMPTIQESLPVTEISKLDVDLLFPVLHGTYGEDGGFQSECEAANIKYVGSGVSASANGMDKAIAKKIFANNGLAIAPDVVAEQDAWKKNPQKIIDACEKLGLPQFVKPSSSGSSRGTHKVKNIEDLKSAISDAFRYDQKVLIEKAIVGQEIECAVLEKNGEPIASPVGEIQVIGNHEFYDFEAKYLDGSTKLIIPAKISVEISEEIRAAAIKAFKALDCKGLARVDFFYNAGELIINEINTMPGFTSTSMYPRLWQAGGISYQEIISILIEGALAS